MNPVAPPTEAMLVAEIRERLAAVIEVMEEARQLGITIDFGIGLDAATGKTAITLLKTSRSHL